jgi:hypothetical protein
MLLSSALFFKLSETELLGKLMTFNRLCQRLSAVALYSSLLMAHLENQSAIAQGKPEQIGYCHLSVKEAQTKESLRLQVLKSNKKALERYRKIIQLHAKRLQACRDTTWPQKQAIWLRLYPCDLKSGALSQIMDRIVNLGYNQVNLGVFYDGRVLLPATHNPTIWPSVTNVPGAENLDLLAQAINKGHERGLQVYAWMFTLNFGYSYALRQDRGDAIARNGKGETSLYVVHDGLQVFVDPYNSQARSDYGLLVREILNHHPDGILFDYVRYPRQLGGDSVATKVTDLWLYTSATQMALFHRAKNLQAQELIRRFLFKGYISASDITEVAQFYPQESEPLWEGRNPVFAHQPLLSVEQKQAILQSELWNLVVSHAMQGVLDFVNLAAAPAWQKGILPGVVFFPEGNQNIGQGYDSRLQPWDRFSSNLAWYPMAYANCGDVSCILAEVQRVLSIAKPETEIFPAISGKWGESMNNRPSLEVQMQALKQFAPRINGVSHFAYSWQFPQDDRDRKACHF